MSSPLSAEEPADGDGLEEADPEERHPRGRVEVHQLEEIHSALGAHGHTQGKQQAAHAHYRDQQLFSALRMRKKIHKCAVRKRKSINRQRNLEISPEQ